MAEYPGQSTPPPSAEAPLIASVHQTRKPPWDQTLAAEALVSEFGAALLSSPMAQVSTETANTPNWFPRVWQDPSRRPLSPALSPAFGPTWLSAGRVAREQPRPREKPSSGAPVQTGQDNQCLVSKGSLPSVSA